MTGIELWSTTAASNNSSPPNGWPEGQAPSSVNDCARQMMASVRTWYEDAQWINWGDTTVYVASTQFKIVGVNVTSRYIVGRRVRAVGSTTGTIYGTITVSSFSTDTTVTVSWDSGSLSNETLTISIGILTPTNVVFPSPFLAGIGLVTAPAFSFTADPNTGMYSSTADNLDFACGGARQLKLSGSASAVNYPRLSGAVTGSYVTLAAEGSDTNTGINFIAKGNAGVSFNTNGSSANTQVFISHTASPVNYVNLTGAATAGTPTISVLGSDTNIDLTLAGKGSGVPKAPTASPGANTTQIATTAFVTAAVASAGTVKQVVRSSTTTGSDLTTTVPLDNTIVQNTEGTEVLTQAITPTSGSSVLKIVALHLFSMYLLRVHQPALTNSALARPVLQRSILTKIHLVNYLVAPVMPALKSQKHLINPRRLYAIYSRITLCSAERHQRYYVCHRFVINQGQK